MLETARVRIPLTCRMGRSFDRSRSVHEAISFESSRPLSGVNGGGSRDGALGGCYIASSVAGTDDGSEVR
jgi:hypothetical protein